MVPPVRSNFNFTESDEQRTNSNLYTTHNSRRLLDNHSASEYNKKWNNYTNLLFIKRNADEFLPRSLPLARGEMFASDKNSRVVPYAHAGLFCSTLGQLTQLSHSLRIACKVYGNCSHIFFYRMPLPGLGRYARFLSPANARRGGACHGEFLVLSRYWKLEPGRNTAVKFCVIEFIFSRFITDARPRSPSCFRQRGCIFREAFSYSVLKNCSSLFQ